jgi:hypothetical protein
VNIGYEKALGSLHEKKKGGGEMVGGFTLINRIKDTWALIMWSLVLVIKLVITT